MVSFDVESLFANVPIEGAGTGRFTQTRERPRSFRPYDANTQHLNKLPTS